MGQSMRKPGASLETGVQSGVHRRASRAGELLSYPNAALERPSYEVDPRSPETIEVAAALIGTLRAMPGCSGLSAPQLGYHGRILCVDVTGHDEGRSSGLVVLANPELLSVSGRVLMREECTSLPHTLADVVRPSAIVVRGVMPGSGRSIVLSTDGYEARCLLHEIDHLDGISMLDRVIDATTQVHRRCGE
jgi:peptide deformylase